MRTTVTLDADTDLAVRRLMERRGFSFKRALNELIRAGAGGGASAPVSTRVHRMGVPSVALDKALALAADLEDEEIVRRMRTGQ